MRLKPLLDLQRTNTILYCRRWAETVDFYKARLLLPVRFENDWFVEFQLTDTTFLSIAAAARATIEDVAGQGITLTWQVPALAPAQRWLAGQGVATTAARKKWGAWVLYFHDPEGHRLELWADHLDQEMQPG